MRNLTPYLTFLYTPASLLLPRRLHRNLSNGLTNVFLRQMPGVREAVTSNLRVAVGEHLNEPQLKRLVRRVFTNYGLYMLDYMALPFRSEAQVLGLMGALHGKEHIHEAREKGKGVIIIGPHLGNWELAGFLLKEVNCKVSVLSIRDPFPVFDRYRARFRDRAEMKMIYVGGPNDAGSILDIQAALARNEAVAMLGDRIYSGRSQPVRFFGEEIEMPSGPLHIAALTGAPLVPVVTVREGDRYVVRIRPAIEVHSPAPEAIAASGQALATEFEALIRRYPDQWYNFHPVFEAEGLKRWRQ